MTEQITEDEPPTAEDLAYLATALQEEEETDPYDGLTMADVDPGAVMDSEEADRWAEAVHDARAEQEAIEAEHDQY